MRIGLLSVTQTPGESVVYAVINADSGAPYGTENADWVDMAPYPYAGIGWIWDGNTLERPTPTSETRYVLTMDEWVGTWTQDEWENLQGAAYERGYTVDWTGHPLDGQTVPKGTQRRLRQLFDAITLTNSFDVISDKANAFYGYLESVQFIDSARRAELQSGVTE